MAKLKLDAIDRKILSELQKDGRISVVKLSSRVNLTNTPCSDRVKRLEKAGVVEAYRAELDSRSIIRRIYLLCPS